MSMSLSLHTKTSENFKVKAKLTSTGPGNEEYPVIQILATPNGSHDYQEVTIYPSFKQVKEMHEQLSKLIDDIEWQQRLDEFKKTMPTLREDPEGWHNALMKIARNEF